MGERVCAVCIFCRPILSIENTRWSHARVHARMQRSFIFTFSSRWPFVAAGSPAYRWRKNCAANFICSCFDFATSNFQEQSPSNEHEFTFIDCCVYAISCATHTDTAQRFSATNATHGTGQLSLIQLINSKWFIKLKYSDIYTRFMASRKHVFTNSPDLQ